MLDDAGSEEMEGGRSGTGWAVTLEGTETLHWARCRSGDIADVNDFKEPKG